MHPLATKLLFLPLLAVLTSCSTSRDTYYLDYTQYPDLPDSMTSTVLRSIAFAIPGVRHQAIYGNYGGPGSRAGRPIDDMDEMFRRHDIAYLEGATIEELHASDRLLVSRLRALDPNTLNWSEAVYRWRAITFFTSSLSNRFGKPWEVRAGRRTRPTIIPGRREEAEQLWKWSGPDPDAARLDAAETFTPKMTAADPAPDAPRTGRQRQTFPSAGKFAGRRR